jgi:hypothetical protein
MNAPVTTIPTIDDLISAALDNEFYADLTFETNYQTYAAGHIHDVISDWCHDANQTYGLIGYDTLSSATQRLVDLADAEIERRAQVVADELADAQDAGDVDRDGQFVPYSKSYGV